MSKLTDFKVLTFDCYGTLIDWESGIWDALQPLWLAGGCEVPRQEALLAFAEAESAQQAATPDMLYPRLLTHVHRTLAKRFGLTTTQDMDRAFGNSVAHWPAFPDSADALRILKKHYQLVILSNVNRDGFAASNRKLGVSFDAIYTAQDVGSYKPNPANFDFMLNHLKADLGLEPSEILHTAQSLFHDHVPATRAGLTKCWIDRQNLADGGGWGATAVVPDMPEVSFRFTSMMEMAEAVAAE
ncbi:MAG: haloacid dehalogenase type II [Pseudomonadota bacterium]